MRIIHIVENLDKGAVENWLVRAFLESRRSQPASEWTFYCILGEPGRLDEQVRHAGGNIVYSPVSLSRKLAFLRHLRKTLKQGHYDVVHAHHDYLSGFYLLASVGLSFRKRLLHIHNTDRALPVANKWLHNALLLPFRWIGQGLSDVVVGISENTLREFVGRIRPVKHKVLYCGLDLAAFKKNSVQKEWRPAIGIPLAAKCLLFAGRMTGLKNPLFLLEVLEEVSRQRNDVYAVFIGSGHLQPVVMEKARSMGLADKVRVVGWVDDMTAAMRQMDVFVYPRLEYPKEGLGLVVVEAQAAGLPSVVSYGVTSEAVVIPELVRFVPLDNNPWEWAEAVLKLLDAEPVMSRSEALDKVLGSRFELGQATRDLLALYN